MRIAGVCADLHVCFDADPGFGSGRDNMSSATLELCAVNASVHRVNEHIELDDLDTLKSIYRQVLERLLLPA